MDAKERHVPTHHGDITRAAQYLADADAILVCAGAGMSFSPGNNVYGSAADFRKHYPQMPRWGYRTAYECMGLHLDYRVPDAVKWGWWVRHWTNMRFAFPVPTAYEAVRRLLAEGGSAREGSRAGHDYFVLTSNVDGCFERSGLESSRIYTPQGDMSTLQCLRACRSDAVWESKPLLDELRPLVDPATGAIPDAKVPKCPHCGGPVFANLRGGDWFLHHRALDEAQDRFIAWVEEKVETNSNASKSKSESTGGQKTLAVLEVGVGENTPIVTKYPVEGIARELGARARFIRVNPSPRDATIPADLMPFGVQLVAGTEVLEPLCAAAVDLRQARASKLSTFIAEERKEATELGVVQDASPTFAAAAGVSAHHQHSQMRGYDWRDLLRRLRNR